MDNTPDRSRLLKVLCQAGAHSTERDTHMYKPGETVNLHPVEWTTETEGYLTHVSTTYRDDQNRKVIIKSDVRKNDRERILAELEEQLSHKQVTYPE